MSAVATKALRIGEVAELTGTTPRTIRYYEEIGLLPGAVDRAQGRHRSYTEADVERVREIIRLRDLLGLSLDQLSELLEAETARAELRKEYRARPTTPSGSGGSSTRRSATSPRSCRWSGSGAASSSSSSASSSTSARPYRSVGRELQE